MKLRLATIFLCAVFLLSGCYLPISGKVVDAETNAPIEGAVVLVEWTKKHGFGDAWTESYKVFEAVSDKEGKVKVEECYSPFVEPPDMAIYKIGYVTWSSRNIFPSWKNRDDFQWKSGNIYKLEKFKDTYSYVDHDGFTSRAINDTIGWENKKLFMKAYYNAVEGSLLLERSEREKKRQGGMKQ